MEHCKTCENFHIPTNDPQWEYMGDRRIGECAGTGWTKIKPKRAGMSVVIENPKRKGWVAASFGMASLLVDEDFGCVNHLPKIDRKPAPLR